MGTPDKNDTQQPAGIEAQVNSALKSIVTDEDGNFSFPEDTELSPELQFAATAEKRRRDTQASFTKHQQGSKELEAINTSLTQQLAELATPVFTKEESEELESLKYDDPDAWKDKLDSLTKSKRAETQTKIDEITGTAGTQARTQFESERRAQVLSNFNDSSPIKVTQELIDNEIPPRITKKLAEGKISFEAFLDEVVEYVNTGKVVHTEKTLDQPNLGKLSGGQTPTDTKPEASLSETYKKTIY